MNQTFDFRIYPEGIPRIQTKAAMLELYLKMFLTAEVNGDCRHHVG